MAKKLSLDDLKVQSFVTTLTPREAGQIVGGTALSTDCICTVTGACGTPRSYCCDTNDSSCYTGVGDPNPDCGTNINCSDTCSTAEAGCATVTATNCSTACTTECC